MASKWIEWDNKTPTGIIEVLYTESKVFPVGAIVQADAEEVKCGVTGDKNPTAWRKP